MQSVGGKKPIVIGGVELDHKKFAKSANDHLRNKVVVVDDVDK